MAALLHFPVVLATSVGSSSLVEELGLCVLAAGFLSAIFERLRIPTIAALLVAGVVLGPVGARALDAGGDIETIANLGLTLLLFVIGLEVNPRALMSSGGTLLWTGLLQVPLTVLVAFGLFSALPVITPIDFGSRYAPLYLALASAFSSTLLVARFLQERRVLDTVSGRLTMGVLVFQDIWAIIVLALQASFEAPQWLPIVLTFAGIALLSTLATLGARFVLPHLFAGVARTPELVVSLALSWCFAVALTGSHLGDLLHWFGVDVQLSVSREMGALIAGMTIASFPYHHEVAVKVSNLRDFFVTLFFVALGMSIPIPDSAQVLLLAAVLAVVAVLLRFLVFGPLFFVTGLDRNNAVDASTKLAQISEFCLVIAYLGVHAGHIDHALASVVIFAFVLTALATPLLFTLSTTLPLQIDELLSRMGITDPHRAAARNSDRHEQPQIVILGFHRMAAALLQDISRQHPEFLREVLVVDLNVLTHSVIKQLGVRVMYGSAGSKETLLHAGVERAKLVISTIPDELLRGTSNQAIVEAVRAVSPNTIIFACGSRAREVDALYQAGATYVYMPSSETANGVFAAGLAAMSGKLDDYRSTREAACGPLQTRLDVERMSS
ncbi:MAG TPA: cation:proton antiporter [Polyangiales bacterium]|nr:cation:proton antiporter [Polyangiales bacterium]